MSSVTGKIESTTWRDSLSIHRQMAYLTWQRAKFRSLRLIRRMRSPRRILATTIALLFVGAYIINSLFFMASRTTADPERLRLWLSGGMSLYLIYHATRCVWTRRQEDLELCAAEQLWLGGAPLQRSTLAVYFVYNIIVSAMMKTSLLVIVLARDVTNAWMLALGVFVSLLLLELIRLVWQRWTSGLSDSQRQSMRIGVSLIAGAVIVQFIGHLVSITPPGSAPAQYVLNSFRAIGLVASSDAIQWISLPWLASSSLTVVNEISIRAMALLVIAVTSTVAAVKFIIVADQWSTRAILDREKQRLATDQNIECGSSVQQIDASTRNLNRLRSIVGVKFGQIARRWLPGQLSDASALVWRQSICVRRYYATILFSFAVPVGLCLSPLLTGRVKNQWSFVVGGIALCTMLLAPPALRIDFRRDLKRMLLLRSLPIRPFSTVVGQLTLPVMITLAFQTFTLLVAAAITKPGWDQLIVWSGMLSALAVGTFAAENGLFLTYPHHERAQGLGMVIRANVVFLAKVTFIVLSIVVLLVWLQMCKTAFPEFLQTPIYVSGAIIGTWTAALIALVTAAWCWRRFDLSSDLPPE